MTIVKIKKQKAEKIVASKENLNFKIMKNCLEATQLDNKITYSEKNKIDIDRFFYYKGKHKEFLKKQ